MRPVSSETTTTSASHCSDSPRAALCLVPSLGFNAVCFASPAAWVMADMFLFPAYFHCMKKQGCAFRFPVRLTAAKAKG